MHYSKNTWLVNIMFKKKEELLIKKETKHLPVYYILTFGLKNYM